VSLVALISPGTIIGLHTVPGTMCQCQQPGNLRFERAGGRAWDDSRYTLQIANYGKQMDVNCILLDKFIRELKTPGATVLKGLGDGTDGDGYYSANRILLQNGLTKHA
jgi:hypothetical protein